MNGPRCEPYLPLLPETSELVDGSGSDTACQCTPRQPLLNYYSSSSSSSSSSESNTPTEQESTNAATTANRPFSALADDSLCLQCASPLSTNCGFSNCALTHDEHGQWHLELAACECEACEQHAAESVGDADAADGDIRRRLLDRHRFSRLDEALGVDEPLECVRARVHNRVPVLQLRLLLAPDSPMYSTAVAAAAAGADAVQELFDNVFCSFTQSTLYVASDAGQRVLERDVFACADALEVHHQLAVPEELMRRPREHLYFSALLLRVATALRMVRALTTDLRHCYATSVPVQQLVLALQLFADTHLDLHLFCDAMGGNYTDAYLEFPLIAALTGQKRRPTDVLAECVFFTPLERCYPHPLRAVYAGELVDLTCSLPQANIWSNVRSGWASKTNSLLHMLLVKAVNKKCMVREFAGMMSQELGRQPSLMIVLLNMLEVTLLGAFPGPRQRPAWRARLSVRRSMHMDGFRLYTWCSGCHKDTHAACPLCPGGSVPTAKSGAHKDHLCPMCAYVRANKYFIFFAIKEMYVFYVRRNGVINTLLEQEAGWIEHWSLLLRALDDARQIVSDVFAHGGVCATPDAVRDSLQRASAHMALLHDCNKPTMMHMSKEIYFWELLLAKMSRHHGMEIVAPFWTGCQEPGDFLLAPRREAEHDPHAFPRPTPASTAAAAAAAAAVPIALTKSGAPKKKQKRPAKARLAALLSREAPQFYECDVPLAHLGGRRWCDVHTLDDVERVARFCVRDFGDLMPTLLASVGMAPAAVDALQAMMHNSRVREMPDNQLQERCEQLRRAPHTPVDFHLLHHFLRCMAKEHAIGSWPLDLEQAGAQARALRARHRLARWETLPLAATHVFVCRNDERVFANIVEPAEHTERDEALRGDGTALPLRKKVIAARGVTDAYYCHERQALMCPKDIDSSMCRELRKKGQQRVMWMPVATHPDAKKQAALIAEAKKNANSIRESLQSSRACQSQVLESINLLGRVWRVGSRAITLCVRCGSVCYWQDSCMSSEGMTCGREVRFAPRARFTELRQFVTPATQQLRTAQPGTTLIEMRETMLCAPRLTGTRADIFTRTRTPVFDDTREYDRLSLINARLQTRALMITAASNEPASSTPPLVDAAAVEDSVSLTIETYSGGGGSATSIAGAASASAATVKARPRPRRPQTRNVAQQIADKIEAGARSSASDAERAERAELLRVRDELARAVTDEDVARIFANVQGALASVLVKNQESLLNEERRARDALPFAEQHRARPHNYDEQEWAALADDERFFAWTFEGRAHRTALLYAQAQLTSDREEQCERLRATYALQVERWRAERYFEQELEHLRDCDITKRQIERASGGGAHAFASDAFSEQQLDDMRRFFIGLGTMPVRYEVCCAFCRTVCDPKGAYCSLWVANLDRLLVDPRTNVPLDERGLVRIFLCANCFDKVQYNLLRAKPLPLASDVFLHIQAQRARARDQYLRKKK